MKTGLIICLLAVLSAIPTIFPFGIEFSFPNLSTRFWWSCVEKSRHNWKFLNQDTASSGKSRKNWSPMTSNIFLSGKSVMSGSFSTNTAKYSSIRSVNSSNSDVQFSAEVASDWPRDCSCPIGSWEARDVGPDGAPEVTAPSPEVVPTRVLCASLSISYDFFSALESNFCDKSIFAFIMPSCNILSYRIRFTELSN